MKRIIKGIFSLFLFFSCSPCQQTSTKLEIKNMSFSPDMSHLAFYLDNGVISDRGLYVLNQKQKTYFRTSESLTSSSPVSWKNNNEILVKQVENKRTDLLGQINFTDANVKLFNIESQDFRKPTEPETTLQKTKLLIDWRMPGLVNLNGSELNSDEKIKIQWINKVFSGQKEPEFSQNRARLLWTPIENKVFLSFKQCKEQCSHTLYIANLIKEEGVINQVKKIVELSGFPTDDTVLFGSYEDSKLTFIQRSLRNTGAYAEYVYDANEEKTNIIQEFSISDFPSSLRLSEGTSLFKPHSREILFSVINDGIYAFNLDTKETIAILKKSELPEGRARATLCSRTVIPFL